MDGIRDAQKTQLTRESRRGMIESDVVKFEVATVYLRIGLGDERHRVQSPAACLLAPAIRDSVDQCRSEARARVRSHRRVEERGEPTSNALDAARIAQPLNASCATGGRLGFVSSMT